MKPDTYDEVVAQRDAARAAVKAWEDKEASRGMCCWQMEQERDAARAEAARLRALLVRCQEWPEYAAENDAPLGVSNHFAAVTLLADIKAALDTPEREGG